MRSATLISCSLAALVGCCLTIQAGGSDFLDKQEREAQAQSEHVRANFKLPKLLDFETYKRAFGKSYRSPLEELRRLKLFLVSKLRAFLTSVRYKHFQLPYYLGINSRSDWTKREREASRMKLNSHKAKGVKRYEPQQDVVRVDSEPVKSAIELDEIESELKRAELETGEVAYEEFAQELKLLHTAGADRKKREANTDESSELEAPYKVDSSRTFEQTKTETRVESDAPKRLNTNNLAPRLGGQMSLDELDLDPDFRPLYIRQLTQGKRRDYSKSVRRNKVPDDANRGYGLIAMTASFLERLCSFMGSGNADDQYENDNSVDGHMEGEEEYNSEPARPDGVWVDHRESSCMFPAQSQGLCGSCYAFATIAYLEWAYCKETGLKVKMSEQYVVDCGSMLDDLSGCNGGEIPVLGAFLNNHGLELAPSYSYTGFEGTCGYHDDVPMTSRGQIRLDMFNVNVVSVDLFEEHLPNAPIIVVISARGLFDFYGGGVWDGKDCGKSADHAVLIIGHGREDGQEYWLIRNSHGEDYGIQGHLKLNKNSDCIYLKNGYVFGSILNGKVHLNASNNTIKADMRKEHVSENIETSSLEKPVEEVTKVPQ